MTTQIEAMKMMVDALYDCMNKHGSADWSKVDAAINAGHTAIEAAEKVEPNYRAIADAVVRNLEGRKQVIDLDLEEELVEEIMQEMTDTIRDGVATPSAEIEELRKDAFDKGWIMATQWSGEDHLLADMDSAAYKEERDAAMEKQP